MCSVAYSAWSAHGYTRCSCMPLSHKLLSISSLAYLDSAYLSSSGSCKEMIGQCHTIRLYGVIAHARDTIAHAHTCTQYKHDAEATRSINKRSSGFSASSRFL